MRSSGKQDEASPVGNTITMSSQGYQDLVGVKNGKNLYWTTDMNAELPIKMAATGMSANIKPTTLPILFREAV